MTTTNKITTLSQLARATKRAGDSVEQVQAEFWDSRTLTNAKACIVALGRLEKEAVDLSYLLADKPRDLAVRNLTKPSLPAQAANCGTGARFTASDLKEALELTAEHAVKISLQHAVANIRWARKCIRDSQ